MNFHLHEISINLGCSGKAQQAARKLEPFFWRGMPYPISHPLWRMGFHDDDSPRDLSRPDHLWVGWLFQSFENLYRLTSISLIMDYLLSFQDTELEDTETRILNDALGKLGRPSLGDWKTWLDKIWRTLVPRGQLSPFLDHFSECYKDVSEKMGEMIHLRNELASTHGTRGLSPEHTLGIARDGMDLLLPILNEARWFEGCVAYLLDRPMSKLDRVHAICLDQPTLVSGFSASQKLDLACDLTVHPAVDWNYGFFEFVLVDTGRKRFQPLSALTVHKTGLSYKSEFLKRDVIQLYAGHTGKKIIYKGMGYIEERLVSSKNIDSLATLFKLRQTPLDRIVPNFCTWKELADRCKNVCKAFLAQKQSCSGFDAEIFMPRLHIKKLLRLFREASTPALLLVGRSGIGKTWEVCHLVEDFALEGKTMSSADQTAPQVSYILPIAAAHLPYGITSPASLMKAIMEIINISGEWKELRKQLQKLNHRTDDLGTSLDSHLLLTLDGINEYEGGSGGKRLCDVIQVLVRNLGESKINALKVLYTIRSEYLNSYFENRSGKHTLPDSNLHYHNYEHPVKDFKGNVKAWLELEQWDDQELAGAYERYCKQEGPTTTVQELLENKRLCKVLRHPFIMRLTCEEYSHRPLPRELVVPDVYRNLVQRAVRSAPERWEFLCALLKAMEALSTVIPFVDDLIERPRLRKDVLNSGPDSLVSQLIQENILSCLWRREQPFPLEAQALSFAHEGLGEYLFSYWWLAQAENVPDGIDRFFDYSFWEDLDEKNGQLGILAGAGTCLFIQLQRIRPEDVGRLIVELGARLPETTHNRLLYPAVFTFLETPGETSETIRALWNIRPAELTTEQLGRFYYNLGKRCRDRGFQKEAFEAFRRALGIQEQLIIKRPEHGRLVSDLGDTYNDFGVFLSEYGDDEGAQSLYRKALEKRDRLAELHPELWWLVVCQGVTRSNLALSLYKHGYHEEAELLLRKALEILDQVALKYPHEPLVVRHLGMTLHNMAIFLCSQRRGQDKEIESLFRRALEISAQFATGCPEEVELVFNIGHTYRLLATVLLDQGRHNEAEPLFRRALGIYEELPRKPPQTAEWRYGIADTCGRLAILLVQENRCHEEVEFLRDKFLKIYTQLAKSDSKGAALLIGLANVCSDLAFSLVFQGHHVEAESLFRRALETCEKLAKTNVLSVDELGGMIQIYSGLALCLLHDRGEYEQAESLCFRALEIRERLVEGLLRRDDLLLGTLCNELAEYFESHERRDGVEIIVRKAVEINEKMAKLHPEEVVVLQRLGSAYNHLGWFLQGQELFQEAESLFRKSLRIRERLDTAHPEEVDVRQSLVDTCIKLADFLENRQRFEEAEALCRKALEISEKLVRAHPKRKDLVTELIVVCNNLAVFLENRDRLDEAEALYRKTLVIAENLAKAHPKQEDLLETLRHACNNLAVFLENRNRFDEALVLYRKALEINAQFTTGCPEEVGLLDGLGGACLQLAISLQEQGRHEEAESLCRKALEIREGLVERQAQRQDLLENLELTYQVLLIFLQQQGRSEEAKSLYLKARERGIGETWEKD